MTFVGFIIHYVHNLDPFRRRSDTALSSPRISDPNLTNLQYEPPVLLLAGYSYGAMVTTHLPPLDAVLKPFISPSVDSDAAQIRLRAEHLAEQQNVVLGSARSAMTTHSSHRSRSNLGVRVGGDEGGSPRKSHESHGRRSFSLDAEDRLRRGVSELIGKTRAGRHGHRLFHHIPVVPSEETPKSNEVDDKALPMANIIIPLPAYLMVSPLQGLVTHLATMSLVPSALAKAKDPEDEAAEEKLVRHPSLAIYGDKDVFVPATKLRAWADRLSAQPGSQFHAEEIATAGHFWAEEGVLYQMKDQVDRFADSLLQSR